MAFATIAGLPPEYGLYTAMVTPIVAALFGSSLHLISGPTTAISIVVFSALSNHAEPGSPAYIQLALTMTFLAGVYQLGFALARMGVLVNFVSHTVVVGFTAGAAILIATSQIKYVLGINVPRGDSFLHTWLVILRELPNASLFVLSVAMITLVTAFVLKKLLPRIPNMLLGLIVGGSVSLLLGGEERGISYVGEIPAHLPPLSHPDFSLSTIRMLAPQAFAVALLGLIEDLDPSKIDAEAKGGALMGNRKSRTWDEFVTRWDAKTASENGMLDEFIRLFAQAYRKAHDREGLPD